MKKYFLKSICCIALICTFHQAEACVNCNREIREAIFNSTFYPNLFVILSPFIGLAVVTFVISIISIRNHKAKVVSMPHHKILSPVPLTAAAIIIGMGIGGFIDGIVLHQILQWHEMLSNKIPPTTYVAKSVNMFWDGIFHAFTLIVTMVGIVLLWNLLRRKDIDRSGNLLVGGLLLGWGIFNLLEGIADHQLLKLHNVREVTDNKEIWNFGFLGFSVLLVIIGLWVVKQRKADDGVYSLS